MHDPESHEMELRGVDEAGMEEWYCPTCGRHFLMRWPPDYNRTILVPGDEYATHVGGKGGLVMGGSAIAGAETTPAPAETEAEPEAPLSSHVEALLRNVLDRIEREDGGEQ